MDSTYINALETRVKWARWAKEQQISDPRDLTWQGALKSYIEVLEQGDTFFMNSKFCSLVDHARRTVPDDLAFESNWLQAKNGWMWIEQPFSTPEELIFPTDKSKTVKLNVKISALGWRSLPEGETYAHGMDLKTRGRAAGKGATQFLCFQNFEEKATYVNTGTGKILQSREKPGFGCWSYFMLQDGDKVIDRIHQFESVAEDKVQGGGQYVPGREADELHEIRWIYSAFYLMAQRLAISVHHDTDRHTRRRCEREKLIVPSFIKVVSLRRLEEAKKKARETGEPIEYNWQWEVVGHWRNQYYPSENTHKPIFIDAFIKGPSDKPLKPSTHRLFVARR